MTFEYSGFYNAVLSTLCILSTILQIGHSSLVVAMHQNAGRIQSEYADSTLFIFSFPFRFEKNRNEWSTSIRTVVDLSHDL